MTKVNEKGQIIIFVTLAFVTLGILVGLAIDLGRGYLMHFRLQRIADASSLAAAKALKGQPALEGVATQAAQDAAEMNGYTCCTGADDLSVAFVDHPVQGGPPMRFVQVTGSARIPTTFMRLLNFIAAGDFSGLQVSAFAEAGPERPVDLMLVLDRSGSMSCSTSACRDGTGTLKINALKTAVNEFLDNTFSPDDRVGLVSFATRGCGDANGNDFTGNVCSPDKPLGSPIGDLKTAVNGLCSNGLCGGTNTMEALLTAGQPLNDAFGDPSRATSRKAVLLVTDGQPTFMRRFNDAECRQNPFTPPTLLPSPGNGNAGGGPFPNGCKHGVPAWKSGAPRPYMYRQPLGSGGVSCLVAIPGNWTSNGCPGTQTPGNDPALYQDVIRSTRDTIRGTMFEANKVRNYGFDGGKDVVIFAIAIGQDTSGTDPQASLDANSRCLLARIANDPTTVFNCNNRFTTLDGDTHADLTENWPACIQGPPCIDETQQKGRVFTVDVNGNVTEQLGQIFKEVAALLKLRLTI